MAFPLKITYKTATTKHDFDTAKTLFEAYAHALKIDLCFQDFNTELQTLAIQYNAPKGSLLLAYDNEKAIGCVGVRELDPVTAELKRMFVFPEYRGHKIGYELLKRSLEIAKNLDYQKIKLDTLADMTSALNLYRKMGFYEIPSYYFNPEQGVIYMEKTLA